MPEQNAMQVKVPAKIWIDGQPVECRSDMTVAAALMQYQHQQTHLSVTGQPRFAVCGMGICQECRVSINGQPHRLACQEYCRSGMVINTGLGGQS